MVGPARGASDHSRLLGTGKEKVRLPFVSCSALSRFLPTRQRLSQYQFQQLKVYPWCAPRHDLQFQLAPWICYIKPILTEWVVVPIAVTYPRAHRQHIGNFKAHPGICSLRKYVRRVKFVALLPRPAAAHALELIPNEYNLPNQVVKFADFPSFGCRRLTR